MSVTSLRQSTLPLLLGFLCVGMISACASKQEKSTCDQRDWYETGRRDGAQGAHPDRLAGYKAECKSKFADFSETVYTNGRNAGLVEFCAPDNSFELGRMGVAYYYVCPSTTENDFLSGYRRGQEARKIETANQKLDAEIDTLVIKLNHVDSSYARREIASELEQLRRVRNKNDKELNKITN